MQVQPAVDTRRSRQDTFDLRDQIQQDDHIQLHAHAEAAGAAGYQMDEDHSVMEDDSEGEEGDQDDMDYDDDDSSLSIPNESIDFDLVYALHSFAATVEGQANVVRGDSLYLMDDSNSYWWLVRVLKTQEVGYIPAENIETPFERLARLNKHRNVDLATATQAEMNESLSAPRPGVKSPSPLPRGPLSQSRASRRGISFRSTRKVHRYLPAIWHEEIDESEGEWSDSSFEDQDPSLAQDYPENRTPVPPGPPLIEEDADPMGWDPEVVRQMQARQMQGNQGQMAPSAALQAGGTPQQRQEQEQERLSQQHQIQQQREFAAQQQQQLQQQPQQQQQRGGQTQELRPSNSRERLGDSPRTIDPLQATETRKLTVTPNIARGADETNPYLTGAASNRPEDEREKRLREEEAEEARKRAKSKEREKAASPVSSSTSSTRSGGGKLRKEHRVEEDENGKKEKKKSILGSLFKKKDKKEKNASVGSIDSSEISGRMSEESRSTRSSTVEGVISPTTATAMQQQQQQSLNALRASQEMKRPGAEPQTPDRQVSSHANQLRQRDQQQQALYQQYLNRSPSSAPEVQPSYGFQSASAVMAGAQNNYLSPTSAGGKPRPGSLILTQSIMDGPGVPELSVVRVFAGKNLQTEATFKTVLLNSSTTASDLIRQATQRFRLPQSDSEDEYYLTIKRVEAGDTALLRPEERPLVVFEQQMIEAPKVKRSSVGSISSISSNLSMHPAIKKLSMNDFTDDSAVKFYLNRKGDGIGDDSTIGHGDDADETLQADSSMDSDAQFPNRHHLTVATNLNVAPERFTSPTARFALQILIYPDDLPDDMTFHPSTEAIVFKDTLSKADASSVPVVSPNSRRKVFVFPKNITVAEVIEIALERFGISEGVVDGGDEIEDKSNKRRSTSRVRYGLNIDVANREKELILSSRVIDAFPKPPSYRPQDKMSAKRRSVDSTLLLGSLDDVSPEDPTFILRRATTYRNSTSRHRMSAPLDELALQQLHHHRNSTSSGSMSDPNASPEMQKQSLSRQEIIARQREATRATQRAILSAQANSVRGMDVLLPGNALLRSSRYDVNDRMRYSYVEADGETYDISDIVEEELRDHVTSNRTDLLEGILGRKDAVGEKLNRVLSKIKTGKKDKDLGSIRSLDSSNRRSASGSEYSMDETIIDHRSRSVSPPGSAGVNGPSQAELQRSRSASAAEVHNKDFRSGNATTTQKGSSQGPGADRRQPSIASVMSDLSGYATPATHNTQSDESQRSTATPKGQQKRPFIPQDDFGISNMLTIIEYKNAQPKKTLPPINPVDEMLFGRPIDTQSLHPKIRDVYAPAFRQLEEMDKVLDDYLAQALAGY